MAQVAKQAARVGSTRKHRGREWVPRRSSVTGDAGLQDEWYTSNGVRISIPASNVSESARPQLVSMAEFLADDLRHLFDEQGIDRSKYAKNVSFEDPLTRYTDIDGYLTNISMLRRIFYPDFRLFSVVASGDTELTTRWRMLMDHLYSVPFVGGSVWKPRLAFSGISVMRFDPDTMQFTSHIDKWDSLSNNDYLSAEGIYDLVLQVASPMVTPEELPSPKYDILRRTRDYEIREYDSFPIAETEMPMLAGQGRAFQNLAGYIYGANAKRETMGMTTPVFTSESNMQFALPPEYSASEAPQPNSEQIAVRERSGGTYAARAFNGSAGDNKRKEEGRKLIQSLKRDSILEADVHLSHVLLAQYNEPGVPSVLRRNEVLMPLQGYNPALEL